MPNAYYRALRKFRELSGDRGAAAVEYGLLVGLIAVAIIVALTAMGVELNEMFSEIADRLTTVVVP